MRFYNNFPIRGPPLPALCDECLLLTHHPIIAMTILTPLTPAINIFRWLNIFWRWYKNISSVSAVTSLELESSRCPLWPSASVSCSGSPLVGQKTVIQPDPDLVSSLLNFSDAEDTDSGDDHDHDQEESRLETEPEQEDAASPQPEDEKSSWRKQRKCPESPRRIRGESTHNVQQMAISLSLDTILSVKHTIIISNVEQHCAALHCCCLSDILST